MTHPAHADPPGDVLVRPWRTADEVLIAAAEPLVSRESIYRRFFAGADRFPVGYVERLAANTTAVAVAGGQAVGWAEIATYADPPYAGDLGVLVVDPWQHRRVGPMLVREVLALARLRGISVVYADVMRSNLAARRALARIFGERLAGTADGAVIRFVLPLVPALDRSMP